MCVCCVCFGARSPTRVELKSARCARSLSFASHLELQTLVVFTTRVLASLRVALCNRLGCLLWRARALAWLLPNGRHAGFLSMPQPHYALDCSVIEVLCAQAQTHCLQAAPAKSTGRFCWRASSEFVSGQRARAVSDGKLAFLQKSVSWLGPAAVERGQIARTRTLLVTPAAAAAAANATVKQICWPLFTKHCLWLARGLREPHNL